jgi:Icc-related predicted phosphoesterase
MNDFVRIRHGRQKFRPEDSVVLHEASRSWLVSQFEQAFDGPTVVVTHHLPASKSIATRYANDPLNPAFASRLEDVIERYRPALWIHGHTHEPCDYELFRTRVICNPRGYPGEYSRGGFKPEFTVVV